ncbi:kelch-like protein 24 isoform X1 [Branchiostoma floridae]|uniref:Kelch-like protein 24 isoform X1 n=2 Tax=Branchiostoma floridae TaxID=7739 RepID=A0A9J7MC29_BRAFL|nr:kelch-like protein 24 isoform X1 [Branchiostoma floridae]
MRIGVLRVTMDDSESVDGSLTTEVSETLGETDERVDGGLECDDSDWHPATFLQRLHELRSEGHMLDVTLCAEGKEIPCHRLVLSAFAEYFHAMFRGGHNESKKDKIEIGGVSAVALQLLVDYAYTSKITVTADNVQSLYEAANMLQVKGVEDRCEEFLTDELSSETCLVTWVLADKVSCKRLLEKAKFCSLKYFEEVCTTEEFLELPVDILKAYLSDSGLHAKKEEQVLEVIMRWAGHDLQQRQRHVKALLECVRFSHVEQDYLKGILKKDRTLSSVPGVKELIQDQSMHARPRHIHQEEILVLGGVKHVMQPEEENNKDIYRLSLNCDCVDISPLPESVVKINGYEACAVNNDVVITVAQSLSECKVWQYKPSLNSCTQLGNLVRKERHLHSVVALQGQVYVVGGITSPSWAPVYDVEVYSETTDSWNLVAPLSLQGGVRDLGITTCCGKIFVFGGRTGHCTLCDQSHITDAVQCYDPTRNVWTFVAPLPNPMQSVMACTVNCKIYLVGGQLAHVLCYDPLEECYVRMTGRLAPWCACGATVCGSDIYIIGGCDRKYSLSETDDDDDYEEVSHAAVQCYNVPSDTMILLKEFPLPISEHISLTIPKL